MSEYDEPWRLVDGKNGGWEMWSARNEEGVNWEQRNGERIVACVNALAGIPNPEAVRELIEAVREWTDVEKCVTDERIFKALAAVSAPSTGAKGE